MIPSLLLGPGQGWSAPFCDAALHPEGICDEETGWGYGHEDIFWDDAE